MASGSKSVRFKRSSDNDGDVQEERDDEEQQSFAADLRQFQAYNAKMTLESDSENESYQNVEDCDSDSSYHDDSATLSDSSEDDHPRMSEKASSSGASTAVVRVRSSRMLPDFAAPPPPPPANGHTKRDRACSQNKIGVPRTSKNLVQLLRSRTTLNPARSNAIEVMNSSTPEFKVFGQSYEYVKTRNSIHNWVISLNSQAKNEPDNFTAEHFRSFFACKLRKQLKREWLYWAQVDGDAVTVSQSKFRPCWKSLLHNFVTKHPVWSQHIRDRESVFYDTLEEAGFNTLLVIEKLISKQNKLLEQLQSWRSSIEEAMEKKLHFMKQFRVLEAEIENKDKKLDEFCHWGRKNLHYLLSAPYFKVSPMDYTKLVAPKNYMSSIYGDELITSKQKWTTNDTQTLKRIIVDVILDKEYAELMERYNYLASRITYDQTLRLELMRLKNPGSVRSKESTNDDTTFGSKRVSSSVNKKRTAESDFLTTTITRTQIVGDGVRLSAHYTIKGQELQLWFQKQETALRKLTYDALMKEDRYKKKIDWYKVAQQVSEETAKDRESVDCRLVWLHAARPEVSNKHWSASDVKRLMELGQHGGITASWDDIAKEIGGKTAYQCFFKYRNRKVQTEFMEWDEGKENCVKEVLFNEGPKWGKAAEATMDKRASKTQVQERWKKYCNPILRTGAFSRVEDALLLLFIEKLRGFLIKEGQFGLLMSYLPWRFETVWRDRANNLFSNWIVPWMIEEDKKLLELVKAQKGRKNWSKICEQFATFKNRKGCLTRHKILVKKIGNGAGQFKTVEEYHEAYSMTRYNVLQCNHLLEILDLLKRIKTSQPPSKTFPGLSKDKSPSELELRWMLLDFDKGVITTAVRNLEEYVNSRNSYWQEWKEKNGNQKKTFDRRSFHRDDPKSVASAIHLRGLKLRASSAIKGLELNEFETDVYFYYARFSRTKPVNFDSERKYIPNAKKLIKLPEIRRIISTSDRDDSSGSDWEDGNEFQVRKRGRPRKHPITSNKVTKKRTKKAPRAATRKRKSNMEAKDKDEARCSNEPPQKRARNNSRGVKPQPQINASGYSNPGGSSRITRSSRNKPITDKPIEPIMPKKIEQKKTKQLPRVATRKRTKMESKSNDEAGCSNEPPQKRKYSSRGVKPQPQLKTNEDSKQNKTSNPGCSRITRSSRSKSILDPPMIPISGRTEEHGSEKQSHSATSSAKLPNSILPLKKRVLQPQSILDEGSAFVLNIAGPSASITRSRTSSVVNSDFRPPDVVQFVPEVATTVEINSTDPVTGELALASISMSDILLPSSQHPILERNTQFTVQRKRGRPRKTK